MKSLKTEVWSYSQEPHIVVLSTVGTAPNVLPINFVQLSHILPLWSDAYEYLEVYAGHGAGKDREILFVEQVVYNSLYR